MIYIIGNDGTPQRVDGVGNGLYPINSIYIATTNEKSPASMFGGTWEQIKDCFLWATGDTTSITYTENGASVTKSLIAGQRGGELTHKLTVNELAVHDHIIKLRTSKTSIGYDYGTSGTNVVTSDASTVSRQSALVGNTGGGQFHNNMPPYLSVYCWKRIS